MKFRGLLIVLLLVLVTPPQHVMAQSPRRKIFEVDDMIYGGFIWSSDSRWIEIYIDDKDNPYYDRITQTLQRERPQALIDTRTISAEEHAFFRVADKANVSISPNGRYLLYDSSDPLPPPDSEDEKIDREVMKLRPTYLADRQQRTYTLWRITGGLSSTWWSDDSSGVFVRVNGWESIDGLVGYVTGFQEDVTQFRDMDISEFTAQDKRYFYYDSNNGDGDNMYAFAGHKILMTASDEATGLQDDPSIRSLISFDVNDPSKHRIVEYDVDLLPFPNSWSDRSLLIGSAGFGTDIERYVWVLSDRGLLLYDLQFRTVRLVDSSIVADTTCCHGLGEFSPDGKWLVYIIYDNETSRSAVYLVDLEQLMNYSKSRFLRRRV